MFRFDRPLLRFLVLALLVLMPLRMAWSAAAGYCAHETNVTVSHFGHHAHAHAGDEPGGEDAKAKVGLTDADCSACHAFLGHLPEPFPAAAAMSRDGFRAPSPSLALPSVHLPDIERPKWLGAA